MAALVLLSAKGAPGVTTTAAALTAAAQAERGAGRVLLAELDPSGGSVQVFTGRSASPGLVEAAGRLRRDPSGAAFEGHLTTLPEGVPVLLAPSAGVAAESVLETATARWLPALRGCADHVVADAGRWSWTQRAAQRIVGADVTALVCRSTVADVEASRHLIPRLRDITRRPVGLIVVGQRPYAPEEVAAFLDLPLAGTIAWDPKGAEQLWATGASRSWRHTRLARSAARTWLQLWHQVAPVPPPPIAPPPRPPVPTVPTAPPTTAASPPVPPPAGSPPSAPPPVPMAAPPQRDAVEVQP
jgi:hypothetical protein